MQISDLDYAKSTIDLYDSSYDPNKQILKEFQKLEI